jgi:LPXTG-site transpeptidase (sortase) family protein
MSRGIGLDNPSFRGNIRTYHRRTIAQPVRQPNSPTGLVEDVVDTAFLVDQQPITQPEPPQTRQPILEHQQFPEPEVSLQQPAWQPEPAASDVEDYISEFDTELDEEDIVARQFFEESYTDSFTEYAADEASSVKVSLFRKIPVFGKLHKKDLLTARFALPALAVTVFFIGCGVALQGVYTNRKVQAQVQELSNGSGDERGPSGGEDVPDEAEPDQKTFGLYRVAPDLPRYLRINKIGVSSRVIRVGVKENNELRAPNSIFDTGWYENSAKPGEKGAAVFDGHVHGPTRPGVFFNLKKLVVGDEIEVERGDGVRLKYEVKEVETKGYQEVDMEKVMRSQDQSKSGLNIITCTGKYNKQLKQYEQRQIVYAVEV